MSIEELIELSSDRQATEQALDFRSLKLGGDFLRGTEDTRSAIANLYDRSHGIGQDNVILAVAATTANATVFQGLLQSGDHVICLYPTYGQLWGLPKHLGCEMSQWKLDPDNGWAADLDELHRLIKPNTRLLVLNNPANPTGSYLNRSSQDRIVAICREHNITILADEIFRPFFHQAADQDVPSFVEHDYSKVIVTGSLSKVWGLTGVRVGWMVTKDQAILDALLNARQYIYQLGSAIDERIAAEVLSDRCRPAILQRHREYARENLAALEAFVNKNSDMLSWSKPTAGSTAFIKLIFHGKAIDDLAFCHEILAEEGVLLMPATLCFREDKEMDLQGYVRVHFTHIPAKTRDALDAWDRFLVKRRK